MTGLSADELLRAWETAREQPPAHQALALLGAGFPDIDTGAFSRVSLGQRDAWLLALRERLFGPRMDCVAECPRCGARSEFVLSTRALLAAVPAGDPPEDYTLATDDYRIRFRLPDSRDLDAASRCRDETAARDVLVERLVLEAKRNGLAVPATQLPAEAIDALEARIATCDPLVEILIDVRCSACEHAWRAPLDVASALLMEVSSRARAILRDVHTLARHYHWTESDILALNPARRQAYLEMVVG